MLETETGQQKKGTRVTFLDQTGAKSVEAMIADTVTVRRILPNIITKMNLPVMGPDGQPMSYSLDHKEGGKRLQDNQTLPSANVVDGDHLIVYPEIVAGGMKDPIADGSCRGLFGVEGSCRACGSERRTLGLRQVALSDSLRGGENIREEWAHACIAADSPIAKRST